MSCDPERFDDCAQATDGKGVRTVLHFAGSDDKAIVFGDEWAYSLIDKKDVAKWQVFLDDGRINHIVNMDNVTFVEVVRGDE